MIETWYNQWKQPSDSSNLIIKPLQDHPYNDTDWVLEVQTIVLKTMNDLGITGTPTLTGANRDESTYYLEMFGGFFELDLVESPKNGINATAVRASLFKGLTSWEYVTSPSVREYLLKFIRTNEYKELVKEYEFIQTYKRAWESSPYPPTFVTVDACVVQSGHILVIERGDYPGKGLLALPGGFIGTNEKLLDACVRELKEETRIELSDAQLRGSIMDKECFDNPDRSLRGRTITTCYLFKLNDSYSLPKVKRQVAEVKKVFWMPISDAVYHSDRWYEDHHSIVKTMLSKIKT
jgi:bifunctional NMN adenylyltransferase/nudix hydrolase